MESHFKPIEQRAVQLGTGVPMVHCGASGSAKAIGAEQGSV
jgi:hypothetical protein